MGQDKQANAIEKALDILLAFAPHNQELGTTEVSERVGFHKATTSRILWTLAEYGFLQQNPNTRKFSLGRSIHTLGVALTASLDDNFVQIARPHVDALRERLDEVIGLELWSGGGTVWAYTAPSSRPLIVTGRQGDRLPFHAAAGAKAILAFAPAHQLEPLLRQELRPLTPVTITDPDQFRQLLRKFRQQGFSVDRDEMAEGISALGVPIFNHEGRPFAAIVMVIPSQRLDSAPDSPAIAFLKEAAAAISACYFYQG